MTGHSKDPLDHARTTRHHAGEAIKDSANVPGMLFVGIGIAALAVGLYSLAVGAATPALSALIAAVAAGAVGAAWFAVAHRHVREEEKRWYASHPSEKYEPPAS